MNVRRRPARLAAALCLIACLWPAAAGADHRQVSFFQDDELLVYSPTATVERTLAQLAALGAQRLRITVKWAVVAPAPASRTIPPGFGPGDSAAYAWAPYDRIAQLAPRYGLRVEFNLTGPGPLWAMGRRPRSPSLADHWYPNPYWFLQFAAAAGRRYSGTVPGIPRVSMWSVWNEPNQPGWLAPQWRAAGRRQVASSPAIYRSLLDAGVLGLRMSGHTPSRDTILIGELAPEGYEQPGVATAMTPMPFVRALYCLDARSRRPLGAAARALSCPPGGSARAFLAAHRDLFDASGFAHHPYSFFYAPDHSASDPNFVPIADLGRLERGLDVALTAYGVHRRLPLYLTEYGYQTNPPDPFEIVTPARQAAYLNEADEIAWRDPRVRSVAQFLLRDSPPNSADPSVDPRYWDTFQTGLEFADGSPKPALAAYRMPIWVSAAAGRWASVWGQLRPADQLDGVERVSVQWQRASGRAVRTVATVGVGIGAGGERYFTVRARVPGRGRLRTVWGPPGGGSVASRWAPLG